MNGTSAIGRYVAALPLLLTIAACRPTRTVKLAWDVPAVTPSGYRILVDEKVAMEIAPPAIDPSCKCLTVSVPVPPGPHTLKVVAYSPYGDSPPSAVAVLK
jgi:hypothetical protein